jgi:D-3-phosphoglycerate dehydrogenase
VELDGNETDFAPVGNMIWINHQDLPGMVGRLGSVLGDNKVNIGALYVGRQAQGGKAVALVNVDNEVPVKVLEELKRIPHILNLKFIKFT